MNDKLSLISSKENVVRKLNGFLFITTANGLVKGFIADSDDINSCTRIALSENNIKNIFDQDEIFGCLVGGQYFYFAMPVILKARLKILQGYRILKCGAGNHLAV